MRFVHQASTINNAGTTSTAALDISSMFASSCVAVFSDGTAAGTLKFQASDDKAASEGGTPSTWVDLTGSASVSSGATTALPKIDVCYNWLRVTFVSSGGAGTIAINTKANGF